MAINVKVLDRPIEDVSYIRATIKGMAQTFRHLFELKVTVQYPETKYPLSPRWRGTHRMLTTEGRKNCSCAPIAPSRSPITSQLGRA